jgi:diguanylate cyclase (GGDEF)-like protein
MARLLPGYGAASLVAVLALGAVLAWSYHVEAQRRGVAEGRSEATLVARTAVEPLLDGRPLSAGLTPAETDGLRRLVVRAVGERSVLRLRVRDLVGHVLYSDDGSGYDGTFADEARNAAAGKVVARLTHLNADRNDRGAAGPSAVEIYLPLVVGKPATQVGVLELYLPYAPISHDVATGLHTLYLNLSIGLALLWVVLLAISWSMSRGLRRQVSINAFQAEHDGLTGLPNRLLFRRRAEEALRSAGADGSVAIAIIDLDRFKEINDTLGHHNGDHLLTGLARRLRDHTRPQDTVARLGGDEFGVILTGTSRTQSDLCELRALIVDDLEVNGLRLAVEASIGYVIAPDDGSNVDMLLQRADVAMYLAKAQHAGVVRYDCALDHYDATNLTLVADLRHALDVGELVLHYQPTTMLADGTIEAVEALVRWEHPTMGLLYPDRFIPLAEQTDLIDRLTAFVVTQAIEDLHSLGPAVGDLSLAVNISARNLAHPDFATQVTAILDASGTPTSRSIVEITETALLTDPPRAAAVLNELAAAGVRVSLDDFGCGQTALGYLSSLPVHQLKIDKSFVSDMLDNRAHAAIVRSIVELGHNLGLQVVAEGIETGAVLHEVRKTGCDVGQGYLVARPMPIAELDRWLADRRSHPGRASAVPPAARLPEAATI